MAFIKPDSSTSIPKKTPENIVRIGLDKSDIGARKSQLARADKGKNDYPIVHVKGA